MKKQDIKFNINDYIKVKLTPKGKMILYEQHEQFLKSISEERRSKFPYKLTLDEDGYFKEQMWSIMNTFGSYIVMGTDNVFETNIIMCNVQINDKQ